MAIKPILFNTEMVRAILDGRKTCTRRIVKPQPTARYGAQCIKPPYQPGDILYVRETFAWDPCWDCGLDTIPDGCKNPVIYDSKKKEHGCYIYRADCEDNEYPCVDTWHPNIHMPKEAARIFLKVKAVRVERLQEMWASDVSKEGIYFTKPTTADEMLIAFAKLWDSTIKKSDIYHYGWDANPYVWVIEFERCEKPEGV